MGVDDMKMLEQQAQQLAAEAEQDKLKPKDKILFVRSVIPSLQPLLLPLISETPAADQGVSTREHMIPRALFVVWKLNSVTKNCALEKFHSVLIKEMCMVK